MSDGEGYTTGDRQAPVTSESTTRYTIPSLINGTEYTVRVIATRTGVTDGPPSEEMTGTPAAPTRDPFEVDIVGVPEGAVTGESYELTAQSDEASLVYAWRVAYGGSLEPDNEQMVIWTAPETAGVAWIRVDVTRDDGATAGQSAYVRVDVPAPEPTTPGVTVSPTALTVPEEDTTGDRYTVVLATAPTAAVTVTVAGHAGTDVTPTPAALTFTTMTWDTAQTVTVTAGHDPDTADDAVSLTHSATSTDSDYEGLPIAGVAVTVTDNDTDGAPPAAPQHLRGEPSDAAVMLTWAAPASDGGSAILRYEYALDDSGTWIDAGDDLEETVPGLTNGQSYAVAVRAVNAAGVGPAAEVTATPVTTPAAPQHLRGEPGDAAVMLTWAAPASDGGSAILRYEYAVDDSGTWIDAGGDLEETVPGLTKGQRYTVAVRAVNAAGAGPAAEVTASPVTTPGAPQDLRSEPGDAQVTLRWEAPTSDGGSAILRYEYAVNDSGTWIDAGGDLEETVRDLTSGQSYAVAVRAVNAAGAGPATTVTASPVTTPGAPQRLRSEPGDAQVTLRWEAPTSDGGSTILRYEYAVDDSGTWIDAGGDLEETVRDLTNGQSYAVAVRAVNAAGAGPATTVTSVPADPLPQAWLARFGRTATDHVVDAVSSRWHGGPPTSHLTLGGPQAEALFGWTGLGGRAARNTAADRGDSVRTELASPRLLAPSGGAWTGVAGTGPGMTVAVPDRTTAPGGLGGVDRDAGAPLRGRAAQRALLGAWGLPDPRALTDLRAALMGSSFVYAGAQDDDSQTRTPGWLGAWSAWGRGAASWFSGADGGASLEGEVATAMLGFDSRWGRWRAGVVASHSRGQGTYTPPTAPGGAVASTLTALHPYAGYDVNARTSVWGVVGYGVGEVSLTPARATTARETDLTNTMAAVGGRAALSVRSGRAGRFELALRSDARLTNTAADAAAGLVGATERTRLVRMLLEGAGTLPFALGGVLTPTVEAGLRYDTGDAETGAGLEVGGGLGYAARRLAVTVNARGLLAHQDTAYEEWGFSGAMAYTPSADGRGLSMRLGSGWGATHSGVESLWSRQNAAALVRHAPVDAAQAYQLEVRYGLDGRQGRARWAPYLGVEAGGGSRQALRLGVTLTTGRRLDAGLELGQRQGASGADPEHAAQLRATLRW